MLKQKIPDIKRVGEMIGIPSTEKWKGNCHKIAIAMVENSIVIGRAAYGRWIGPIALGSPYEIYRNSPGISHAWIITPDCEVIDPTRWVFENAKPYIYQGNDSEAYYAEGRIYDLE